MKNTNFLKHFAIIGSGTALNLLIGLITTPIITRIVSPTEYGQLSIFTMYSNIALLVLCLGFDQALVRYYYENDKIEYKRKLLFKCIKLPVIVSSIISIIVVLLSKFKIINFEFNTFIITLLCVYIIIQILYRFSIAIVRLEYNSRLYSNLNILLKVLYIVIAIPFLLIIKKEYLLILIIATIISALVCLIISILANKEIWNFFKKKKNDNIKIISNKELIKYSYPFIISMSITTLLQAIDKVFINKYYSYYEVGIYSSTMSIVHIFSIIQNTFNTLWMPLAVEHYTQNKEEKNFYIKANNMITVIMFFFGLSLIFAKDIFAILLGEKYRDAAQILPFLIFNPIMFTISETTVCGLIFKKKSKTQIIIALGTCISNVIGNYILVPKLGCRGAAISTGISYTIYFILRTLFANKYYYIKFELKKIYIITMITSIYALYNTFHKFDFICCIGYIISILILYVLYSKTILEIVKYIKKNIRKIISERVIKKK